jgi:drug/metabolite transporter (DMT)-like permease
MSEPLEILPPATDAHATARSRRRAVIALLIACVAWGGSFTWAKNIMVGANHLAGREESATLGVLLLLSWRFLVAGIIWMVAFPAARKGWTLASIGRALLLGLPFTVAMIAQQMGLTRTSAAINAFLTSLTVLFVPLILAIVSRKLPHPNLWIGVALAIAGIWLMTGAAPSGFGLGEILGVGCSILFSVHIILINALLWRDTPARMVGGQFIVTGVASLIITLLIEPQSRSPQILFLTFAGPLLLDTCLLVIFATLFAFGLMIFFQPKVDPTRAALTYLTEPVFAALFAFIVQGQRMTIEGLIGAALILAANGLVEWLEARRKLSDQTLAAQAALMAEN